MQIAVMQPYLLPYIGYLQLIASVDRFIVYDNIQYTKRGWINRNRLLSNGKASVFTLPLQKDSDFLNICDRSISSDFNPTKLLNIFSGAYRKAPYFSETFGLLEEIFWFENKNLFEFLLNSLKLTINHIGIGTTLSVSSEIPADHSAAGQSRVLSICNAMAADTYVNPFGGKELYSRAVFEEHSIELKFLLSEAEEYPQFLSHFVSNLSIVDTLMFNSRAKALTLANSGYRHV